jgi:large subunit ribosomal protein L10
MVLTKSKKQSVIEEYSQKLKGQALLMFVNFHGLSVAKSTKLRKELRASGIGYNVLKKTLLKRVLDSLGFTDVPKLNGEVGVIYATGEVTEAPRIVAKFIKQEKEGLVILGGVYESKSVGDDVIKRLAAIPSREVLLTQLAFILTQPVAGFARALQEVSKSKGQN